MPPSPHGTGTDGAVPPRVCGCVVAVHRVGDDDAAAPLQPAGTAVAAAAASPSRRGARAGEPGVEQEGEAVAAWLGGGAAALLICIDLGASGRAAPPSASRSAVLSPLRGGAARRRVWVVAAGPWADATTGLPAVGVTPEAWVEVTTASAGAACDGVAAGGSPVATAAWHVVVVRGQ